MLGDGITKQNYTIGEVASLVGEETHLLRPWETEFSGPRLRKNWSATRVYTHAVSDLVFRLRRLLRADKFTLVRACHQLVT